MYRCDPCWQNYLEGTWANYELQAKQVKNVNYGQIWGFHKNEFVKPFSDPDATNMN